MPDIFTSSKPTTRPTPTPQPTTVPTQQPTSPVRVQPAYTQTPIEEKPAIKKTDVPQPTVESVLDIPPTQTNLFSTLIFNPDGIRFANQEPDEDIVLFFRADFITNVPWVLFTILLLFVPLVISFAAPFSGITISFLSPQLVVIITLFFYLLVFTYAFISFMYWFYNVGIATKNHIIDIDFADITYKNIATVALQEVADIDYTQQGFIQTFGDFGSVSVQTEGQRDNINFKNVPQPGKITHIILQLRERLKE